ncbi:MAG: T9SS type A sorting domain-containing protein [Flavobacteriales bacterium]
MLAIVSSTAQTLTTDFVNAGYAITDLGSITDLPTPYGGLTIREGSPDTLFIGGTANQTGGAVYKVPLVRDAGTQQITGFAGPAVLFAAAPNIDGGLSFAPNGTMLYTRYSMNEFGQLLTSNTTLSIPLTPLGIASSVGSHVLVPAGSPGAGNLLMASYSASIMYKVPFTIGVDGDYQPSTPTTNVSVNALASGPEGIAYVPSGSAGFTNPSMVVSAYSMGKIVAFEVDADGLPIPATARDMITGLSGAEGAFIDPLTGDFLFSTFGGTNRVIRVSGFEAPNAITEIQRAPAALQLAPNPTDGPVRLQVDATTRITAVEVIDVNGHIVLRSAPQADRTIDLSTLPAGVYTVRAYGTSGVLVGRVVRA